VRATLPQRQLLNPKEPKMTILSSLRQSGRAAVLAIALAGVALSAMPAQAAGPNLNFKFNLGAQVAPELNAQELTLNPNFCLTNKQIRNGLMNAGFEDVEFVQELKKKRVRVAGLWDDWYYSLRINRCTHEVDNVKKLYPAYDEDEFDIEF
jgi:hypothetical protein